MLEQKYQVNINGVQVELPKMLILNKGLKKLNLSFNGTNSFNYETLTETYEGSTPLPSEDVLKAKGIEQLEYESTLPTKEEVKASALAKLSALGLTEEEVQAIIK
jgi:hypothetical protein